MRPLHSHDWGGTTADGTKAPPGRLRASVQHVQVAAAHAGETGGWPLTGRVRDEPCPYIGLHVRLGGTRSSHPRHPHINPAYGSVAAWLP